MEISKILKLFLNKKEFLHNFYFLVTNKMKTSIA